MKVWAYIQKPEMLLKHISGFSYCLVFIRSFMHYRQKSVIAAIFSFLGSPALCALMNKIMFKVRHLIFVNAQIPDTTSERNIVSEIREKVIVKK